jgi:hypothetical protein
MVNWIQTINGFINMSHVRRLSVSSLGDVVQILAWFDDDIEHCIVINEYHTNKTYQNNGDENLSAECAARYDLAWMLNNLKCYGLTNFSAETEQPT